MVLKFLVLSAAAGTISHFCHASPQPTCAVYWKIFGPPLLRQRTKAKTIGGLFSCVGEPYPLFAMDAYPHLSTQSCFVMQRYEIYFILPNYLTFLTLFTPLLCFMGNWVGCYLLHGTPLPMLATLCRLTLPNYILYFYIVCPLDVLM